MPHLLNTALVRRAFPAQFSSGLLNKIADGLYVACLVTVDVNAQPFFYVEDEKGEVKSHGPRPYCKPSNEGALAADALHYGILKTIPLLPQER